MLLLHKILNPKPAKFGRLVERAFRRAGTQGPFEYDPAEFKLAIGTGDDRRVILICFNQSETFRRVG